MQLLGIESVLYFPACLPDRSRALCLKWGGPSIEPYRRSALGIDVFQKNKYQMSNLENHTLPDV